MTDTSLAAQPFVPLQDRLKRIFDDAGGSDTLVDLLAEFDFESSRELADVIVAAMSNKFAGHPNADDWQNRAERAEQSCAEKDVEIAAWLRGVAEPLPVNGDKRHILLAVADEIERGEYARV